MIDPILKIIADNPALYEALDKLVRAELQFDYSVTVGKGDKEIGEIVRARIEGMRMVESIFKKIMQLKTVLDSSVKINQAR